jgi:tetratricopeptide (TPR) repeat protein
MLSGVAVFLAMHLLAFAQPDAAQAAFAAGRVAEARRLLEPRRNDPLSQALLARVYLQSRLPQEAAAAARLAESLGASIPGVQHHLALFYAQSGQRRLAAQWESSFALSPEADSSAPLRAALLHAELFQWPDALKFGRLALARQDRPEVRRLLARAAEATGAPEEAITHQRAVLEQLPYDESAHAELGQLLLRLGKFGEGAAFLETAQSKFDKSPEIVLNLGVAYYSQRRFAEAGSRFLHVIELAPSVPQPYIFLAKMIDQLPDRVPEIRTRAEAWYRQEMRNGFAPFVYARALQAAGVPDAEIKPLLLEAIRRDPKQWEFPFELGQLLERQRDFAAAARAYETSVGLSEKVPEIHYRLARVYDRLGQSVKAERARIRHKQLLGVPKAGMQ